MYNPALNPNYLALYTCIIKDIWPNRVMLELETLPKQADNKYGFTDKDVEEMLRKKEEMTWAELEEYYQILARTLSRYADRYQERKENNSA